jgi:ABC-type nitrate/sulfonate/bicarbonate transport system substrate-binding protein
MCHSWHSYTALHRGFFKDEGIDLEIIFMPANLASTAVLNGDVDFNGAVTGTIGAAVQGRPMKVLLFTVSKPLLFLMGQKNIKDLKQLKGKKNRRQLARWFGDATRQPSAQTNRPGAGQGCFSLQMSGNAASRLAVLGIRRRRSVADFRAGKHHRARKGYHELLFLGDVIEFPQNGFGTSDKRIRENPDEVYRMVRATLRGLQFIWDKNNTEAVTNILMKQWKVSDRKMAAEMSRQVSRVLTKDAYVKPESVQVLIDLARDSAKVTKPVTVAEVVDYSFVDKARKELGIVK